MNPVWVAFLIFAGLWMTASAIERWLKEDSERRAREAQQRTEQERRPEARRREALADSEARQATARAADIEADAKRAAAEEERRQRYLEDPLGDYLSYTRLRAFHDCPRKFYYKYVLGREGDESRLPVASGKRFHSWLEEALKSHVGDRFPHAILRCAPSEHRGRALNLAKRVPLGSSLVGVEHEVHYTIGGVVVLGYIDVLYREPAGRLVISDVKTGSAPKIHLEQLEMYAMLLLQSEPSIRLEYHLVDLDESVHWQVGARHQGRLWEDLKANAAAIRRQREFSPIPGGHCRTCPFFEECPDAGQSRGKPSSLRLVQLRTAKRGAKEREREFGHGG